MHAVENAAHLILTQDDRQALRSLGAHDARDQAQLAAQAVLEGE